MVVKTLTRGARLVFAIVYSCYRYKIDSIRPREKDGSRLRFARSLKGEGGDA